MSKDLPVFRYFVPHFPCMGRAMPQYLLPGRRWPSASEVGSGMRAGMSDFDSCIDFLKFRSGISLSIYRPLGDHPHSTSVICSFFANASLRSSERPVGGSDSPPGCHSLPPTALRLPREKLWPLRGRTVEDARPYIMSETYLISVSLRGGRSPTWQSPDITSAPLAPAFKRGLSAEQADWGSSGECHFSPPRPFGPPPS